MTTFGFCFISSYGTASLTAIYRRSDMGHVELRLFQRDDRKVDTHRIILCVDAQTWYLDVEHRVGGRGVSIVRALGRIAPGRTLYNAVEFVQVPDFAHLFGIHVAVFQYLLLVASIGSD